MKYINSWVGDFTLFLVQAGARLSGQRAKTGYRYRYEAKCSVAEQMFTRS